MLANQSFFREASLAPLCCWILDKELHWLVEVVLSRLPQGDHSLFKAGSVQGQTFEPVQVEGVQLFVHLLSIVLPIRHNAQLILQTID